MAETLETRSENPTNAMEERIAEVQRPDILFVPMNRIMASIRSPT